MNKRHQRRRKYQQIVFPKEKAAPPKENYVGRKFGKYLVLEFAGRNENRNALWKCRCECGKESVIKGADLSSHSQCRSCARVIDLTGQRFGRLIALERRGYIKHGHNVRWLCICDCGTYTIVPSNSLRPGHTRSCACLARELAVRQINKNRPRVSPTFKHGGTSDPKLIPIYRVYRGMLNRCYNPNQKSYRSYGAVGVTVCNRWRGEHGFENFLADKGLRPEGTALGRFGDVGPYSPKNTSWQTPEQQLEERRKKWQQLKKAA